MRVDVTALKNATVTNQRQNILRKDDILLTCASETPNECAISSVIRDDIEDNTFLDDHLFALRVKQEFKEIIDTAFLNYYFHSIESRKAVNKTVRGVTRFYISYPSFMKIEIPVPPLPVQHEIVRILDNFTSLEAELEAELEARKKQYEYYRDQLLSFKHPTGGGKSEVEWKTLKETCDIFTGGEVPDDSIKGSCKDNEHRYPIWANGKEVYGYSSTYQIKKDATVISSIGANAGTVYFRKAFFTPIIRLKVIIPKSEKLLISKYIYFYLSTLSFVVKSSSVPNINSNEVKKIKIPIPPIERQRKIVNILERFENIIENIESGLPAEIAARHQQYEYYRDQLLTFKRKS